MEQVDDWRSQRRRILEKAKRIIVKVGSAVLTTDRGLDERVVNRLADQIAALHDRGLEIVLVTSGAVAAGRYVLGPGSGTGCMVHKQAASAVGQSRLMHSYDEAFGRYGKITAQVLLTKDDLRSRERFLNARNTMCRLLDWRVIPVVNENDTVAVQELKLKFGDNDVLSAMVANLVGADVIINLTSAEGVYDDNPLENPGANFVPCIENIAEINLQSMCRGKTGAGTGGMLSKLMAARRASRIGVPTLIVSGRQNFVLERVFNLEELGTWIAPTQKMLSGRKFWLAYHLDPVGTIIVDEGAARALTVKGKSLLAAGIIEVEGNFGMGALVRIVSSGGETLGVGLCNFKASELRRIRGLTSVEIEGVLGPCPHQEVVHRDNLVLDNAL
ncbi:MAG: glutamate 5-kinase [Desulfovibrionales bacterium]|nr:glutamate 5-kinase [Desulfovibrionales bacterium]